MKGLFAQGGRLGRRLRFGLPALGGNFNFLVDDLFKWKLNLQGGGRFAWANLNSRLPDRFKTNCRTGQAIGSRNQPGKLESPFVTCSYGSAWLRQGPAEQGADRARNRCVVLVYYLSLKLLSVRKGPLDDTWDTQDQQQGQADTLYAWQMAMHQLFAGPRFGRVNWQLYVESPHRGYVECQEAGKQLLIASTDFP